MPCHDGEQELENRRRDSFRIEKYMEVMGAAKVGEDHPRIALAKEAVQSKPVEVRTGCWMPSWLVMR